MRFPVLGLRSALVWVALDRFKTFCSLYHQAHRNQAIARRRTPGDRGDAVRELAVWLCSVNACDHDSDRAPALPLLIVLALARQCGAYPAGGESGSADEAHHGTECRRGCQACKKQP